MYSDRILCTILVCCVIVTLLPSIAMADGDVEKGRIFAEKNCGKCHALGRDGESPHEAAPAFRTFGEKWPVESLAESLAEGIVTGHADMPEFVLTPEEIGDFLGYLRSLEQR